jgi:hypothetical protein
MHIQVPLSYLQFALANPILTYQAQSGMTIHDLANVGITLRVLDRDNETVPTIHY